MFDDPKMELERLQEELLTAQTQDDEFDRFFNEIYEEFSEKEPEEEEDYLKDILEEIPTLGQEGRNTYVDNSRHAAPPQRKENNLSLVLIICAECLGIAAVVLWWLARLI